MIMIRRTSRLMYVGIILCILFTASCDGTVPEGESKQKNTQYTHTSNILALVGGTLVDGTGREPVTNATVLIEGDRIVCAGTQQGCPLPETAQLIRADGQWLIPGLVDGHVHFSQTGWVDGRPDLANVQSMYPYEQVIADNHQNPETRYRSYLCSGVTAVFDVGGLPSSWLLRKYAEYDPLAPHIAATGPLLSDYDIPGNVLAERQFLPFDSAESASKGVKYMAANKSDAIKLYYLPLPPERMEKFRNTILDFAEETKRAGIPFITHVDNLDGARFVVEAGTFMLVHSVSDKLVDDEFVDLVKSRNVFYSPTLTVSDGYDALADAIRDESEPIIDDPNKCVDHKTLEKIRLTAGLKKFLPKRSRINLNAPPDPELQQKRKYVMAANLKRLHDAGVPIVTSTDSGNPLTLAGAAIYKEMERMQEAGLSPMAVLVASTRNGAAAMGRENDFGTIENGKIADILIVTADPTESISNVRKLKTVIRAGYVHTQSSLRARSETK